MTNSTLSFSSAQETFHQIEQELGAGMVPRIFLLLEGQPEFLSHIWGQFRNLILQGSLPRTLKEMIGLVVATHTHCDYVQVVHMHSLTLQGVAKEALEALVKGDLQSEHMSSLTQEVLRFAALGVHTRSSYAGATAQGDWESLRGRTLDTFGNLNLSAGEKFEVLGTLALFEQICTMANLLALDPNQP
jgi:AhpD family alkylhydroperoxidase